MTNAVYFGDPAAVCSAAAGTVFTLTGQEARHAGTVRRIAVGETVDIVDGGGHRLSGTVKSSAPDSLEVQVHSTAFEEPPAVRLILVQALAKGGRDEQAVEAATELGVDVVVPWQSERSIVRWRAEKAVKGVQKWESLVRGAAKQSRRSWIPEVLQLQDSRSVSRWLQNVELVFVLHEDAAISLAGRLEDSIIAGLPTGAGVGVIVGPEGGISPQELELFERAGGLTVGLGPHVLRSSTAGPAALAVLNQLLHRW